jgi:hypothetical protein
MDAVAVLLGERPGPKVYVWSLRKSIPKDVRDCIDRRLPVAHVHGDPWAWPRTDFYVQRTALNWQSEKVAAALGAQLVVLPEGAEWLAAKVSELIKERDVYIFRASRVGDRP